MTIIIAEIFAIWIGMGIAMWLLMTCGLYFAVFCEKVCDFFTAGK